MLFSEQNAVHINYTEKIWSMASGAAENRMLEHKRFFSRKNDAQSVDNGDRLRVEIELRQSWSSDR